MPERVQGSTRFVLTVSPKMAEELDRVTDQTGMDRSNIVRAALIEWLDRHPAWHVVEETGEED